MSTAGSCVPFPSLCIAHPWLLCVQHDIMPFEWLDSLFQGRTTVFYALEAIASICCELLAICDRLHCIQILPGAPIRTAGQSTPVNSCFTGWSDPPKPVHRQCKRNSVGRALRAKHRKPQLQLNDPMPLQSRRIRRATACLGNSDGTISISVSPGLSAEQSFTTSLRSVIDITFTFLSPTGGTQIDSLLQDAS